MNRHEFEEEFALKIREQNLQGRSWHQHVEANMHKLSEEALHYIAQNDDGYFFGEWMVRKAVDLLIFEEVVLGKV